MIKMSHQISICYAKPPELNTSELSGYITVGDGCVGDKFEMLVTDLMH